VIFLSLVNDDNKLKMDYSRPICAIMVGICLFLSLNLYSQTETNFNPFQNVYPVRVEKYKNTDICFRLYGIENSTYSEDKHFKFDSIGRLKELTVDCKGEKETWRYNYKKENIIIKKYNDKNIIFAKEIIKKDTIRSEFNLVYTSIEYERRIFLWKQRYTKEYTFFKSGMIQNNDIYWNKEFGSNLYFEYRNERIFKITEYVGNNVSYKEFFFEYEDLGYCNEEERFYGNINKSKSRFHISKLKTETD
jgi:hypothetical protein